MNSKMRSLIALFMVIAVAGVYSFGLQTMRGYAGEEATGQTTGSQSEQDVDAEQDAPSSVAEKTDDGTDAGGSAKAAKGAGEDGDGVGEDGESITAAGEEGESLDGASEDAGEPEDEEIDMTDAVETGDFKVLGDEGKYAFDPDTGVLTITGDVVVSMKDGVTSTSQRIVVANNATVTLNGVNINASSGPAIKIEPGVNATLTLAKNSTNTVTGAAYYAGVSVGYIWQQDGKTVLADLTINGSGSLDATGGAKSAGIGGNYNRTNGEKNAVYYGNITIKSGNIKATGNDVGAGIGSSGNNQGSAGSFKVANEGWGVITIDGGNIEATGSNSAGIGGGNHIDSGKVIINGGTIDAKGASGIGCGTGSSKNKGNDEDKGPGYYWADVEIHGGTITARATGSDNWGGAGIGGGAYCDATIKITAGTIHAYGGNCASGGSHDTIHHGGAGIGGGYEAHSDIEINGGEIYAYVGERSAAAAIGSGGTPNSNPARGNTGRSEVDGVVHNTSTSVKITGGTIVADARQGRGGAGIGGGTSADLVSVTIEGGTVYAYGAASSEAIKAGGAGIGGGLYGENVVEDGMSKPDDAKYHVETDLDVTITGGTILAVGGWGASGIGSGAKNKTANEITIDVNEASIEAYADGTKFAIDTREVKDDGTTRSITEGRTITGDVLQGTFVHQYDQPISGGEEIHQGTEGLGSIKIINDRTGEQKELTKMPDGYRSFATDVNGEGAYTVYSDDSAISNGNGRYFNRCIDDTRTDEEIASDSDILERNVQYTVSSSSLCDNFYLFPVKTVVVEKIAQGADTGGLNATVYFCLKSGSGYAHKPQEESIWTESIEIVNGVPQTKAYFINVDDDKYDVLEIKGENDTTSPMGDSFGSYTLTRITTQHGEAVALPLETGTTHDNSRGITYTVTQDDDELTITASMDAGKRQDGHSVTLSLFADGVLTEYPSKKLNEQEGWEQTWTEIPASKDGTPIQYSVADTSNNAQIDDDIWNDEVKIINTYKKKAAELVITKELPKFIDHKNGNETMGDVNATFFFEITGKYDGGKPYQNTAGIDFNRNSDSVQTVTVALPSDITDLEVKEVYAGNYKLDPDQDPPEVVQNEDGVYTVKFRNVVSDYEYKGGITNKYELDGGISKLIGTTTNPQQP